MMAAADRGLPDRESATVAAWLADRSGIEIVCRDRAGAYSEAIRTGAPDAVQVADRFHLWRNLGEAVDKTVRAHHGCLRQSMDDATTETADDPVATGPAETAIPLTAYGHPSKLAARTLERHALIRNLIAQAKTMAQIAREERLDPRTSAASPPPTTPSNSSAVSSAAPTSSTNISPTCWNSGPVEGAVTRIKFHALRLLKTSASCDDC